MKLFKQYYWVFIMLIMASLGIGLGLIYLNSTKAESVLDNVSVGVLSLNGLTLEEARERISEYYEQMTRNGVQKIEIDGKISEIAYADIDVAVDIESLVETLKNHIPSDGVHELFSESVNMKSIQPVYTYNSGKLISRLEELFRQYEKEPVVEKYEVQDGNLVLIPQKPGIKADYTAMEKAIGSMLFVSQEPFRVSTNSSPYLVETRAEPLYEKPFTAIVSKASVGIDPKLYDLAGNTAESVHSVVIENDHVFSLKEWIDFSLYADDVEKDLLNRMASVVYQSLLPINGITPLNRRPAARPAAYTEPGLEAVIEGEGADLALRNTTGTSLMLLTETIQDSIHVYVASAGEVETGTLSVQRKDQVPPPVITRVNPSLGADQTRVVSEGVPGFTSQVSRVIGDKKQDISSDRYNPISKVVETGEKPTETSDK